MDYEEKYKKALATARKLYNMRGDWTNLEIESIFPELRDSEDERIRKALMQNLKERFGTKGNMGEGLDMPDVLAWFEKKKEPQPVEWSKEDKVMLDEIIDFFENGTVKLQHDLSLYASWLKSLKERYTWKPSDAQMYNLSEAAHYRTAFWDCDILIGLYDELKKLK